MKIGVADGIQQERVLDGIESFRDVYGDSRCTERWFRSVEARGDASDGRKESSTGRVVRAETVL